MKNKQETHLNKEFSLSFVFSIISALLGFAFSFIAAKYLGSDKYGQLQYYLSISSLLSVFMIFGSDNFIIKNIQFSSDKKQEITRAFFFVSAVSILTAPVYYLCAYFFLNKLQQDICLISSIFCLGYFSSIIALVFAFFTGINKNEIRTFLNGIIPHIFLILAFVIHYLTKTLDIFMNYFLFYYIGIYLIICVPFFMKHFKLGAKKYTKSELVTLTLFALTWITYNTTTPIGNIFIGERYQAFGVVGIFSISSQLLSVATLVNGIISNISNPVFSKIVKEGDSEKLITYYQTITRISMYIGMPFFIAFACEAHQILEFFGSSYLGFDLILVLLSISSGIECFTGPCGSVLLMGGKEKENFICSIIRFVTFIGFLVVLIKFTVLAAPIALITSTAIANLFKLYYLWKFQHKNYFNKDIIIPLLVISFICFMVFYGLSFVSNTILWAILNGVIGTSLIILFIRFTPYKRDRLFFKGNKNDVAKISEKE